jgi:hypothetical protein
MDSPLIRFDAHETAAPFLFSEAEIGAEKLEATGEFSGERLLARRPEVYRAILSMSAEGLSVSAMARAFAVSRNTIAAVQDREGFSIEQHKKELLRNVRTAARLSVERVVELVPSITSAKDAAIVAAVMVDKLQLLSGEATARVERVEVSQDKLSEMLAGLPELEAEIVPATGSSGSGSEQKGQDVAGSVAGFLGLDPAGLGLEGSGSDTESDVLPLSKEVSEIAGATLGATSGAAAAVCLDLAAETEGGRGSEFLSPPPSVPTDLGERKIFSKGDLNS